MTKYEAELQALKDEWVKKALADLAEMMFVLGISPGALQKFALTLWGGDYWYIIREEKGPGDQNEFTLRHTRPIRPLEAAELAERLAKEWRSDATAAADERQKLMIRLLNEIRLNPPTKSIAAWASGHSISPQTVYNYINRTHIRPETRATIESAILKDAKALGLR